jgi:xylulokinase
VKHFMKYVIGIDLGTSSVKVLLVNQEGIIEEAVTKSYPLIQLRSGYCEQNPEDWVEQTTKALVELIQLSGINTKDIEGMSFSGQMHGLVLLDEQNRVLRNAILWNDTRTTEQCKVITEVLGGGLLEITKNKALEGFTLPKLLWVKEHEPDIFANSTVFLLPKDYLRFRFTGLIHSEYSDAAGTLLLDISQKRWSLEICRKFDIKIEMCPPLVESSQQVGTLLPELAEKTGLKPSIKVFAGGADNACGAIGAGVLNKGETLCSIGTSGVILSYEDSTHKDLEGKVHFFNHGKKDAYYLMGVTLSAGHSLNWFKETFANEESFEKLLADVGDVPAGSNGLLFTPYISGERTPHADANIRGSFIGMDSNHRRKHFVRAVLEGITFSLNETIEIFRNAGVPIHTIISIGGGSHNKHWLQIQSDIFNAKIVRLDNEQGPGLGAAILAAFGCLWYPSLEECAQRFVKRGEIIDPQKGNVEIYKQLYTSYKNIYYKTFDLCQELEKVRF